MQPHRPNFDPREAIKQACPCGNELYNKVHRLARVSHMAPGNKTGQDVLVDQPVFCCAVCGLEVGLEPDIPKMQQD